MIIVVQGGGGGGGCSGYPVSSLIIFMRTAVTAILKAIIKSSVMRLCRISYIYTQRDTTEKR